MSIPVLDPAELVPGRWYAIGVANVEDKIEWAGAPLLKYEGAAGWFDEKGEQVEFVWDPLIEDDIAVSSADAFMAQSGPDFGGG